MNNTTNDLVYRPRPEDTTAGGVSPSKSIGNYQPPRGEVGWICPVCGRGLAPSTSYCPCHLNNHNNIVCNDGGISILDNLPKEINCNSTPLEAYYTEIATTAVNTTITKLN